jgi:ribosomal protein S12 methylthiotransferase
VTPAPILAEEPLSAPRSAPVRIGFVSLGCPKNLVDSEVMMGMLAGAGAEMTTHPEDADVLVVNTCSFIDSAKQESVDTILEMAAHKQAAGGRAHKLIVAGCLVERYRSEIQANIPEVDAVVGTGELEAILAAAGLQAPAAAAVADSPFRILSATESAIVRPAAETTVSATHHTRAEGDLRATQGRFSREDWEGAHAAVPTYLYNDATPRLLATGAVSAYIKIAEGCDHPCTFCVIPNLRGQFRSRQPLSVIAEAKRLIAQGVREITLIGQDTTCYGEDLGMRDGLAQLLDELAVLPGVHWVRFLYAYPNKVTPRLLETIAKHPTIPNYLDVPLQHSSPAVLKSMRRGAHADIFLKMIERARATIPGLVLRTGFIVGFPGETEADFEHLQQFVREAQFDWMGAFSYSDEQGAGAFTFAGKLPAKVIEQRRRALMRVQRQISRRTKKQWVGRTLPVLVEGPSEETELLWEGRSALHAPEIDGKLYINDFGTHEQLVPGTFYECEITESHDYDVIARVMS